METWADFITEAPEIKLSERKITMTVLRRIIAGQRVIANMQINSQEAKDLSNDMLDTIMSIAGRMAE